MKRGQWERKADEGELQVSHDPSYRLWVYTGGTRPVAEKWSWQIREGRSTLRMGEAPTRVAAEQAAVAEMRAIIRELGAGLPKVKGKA